MRKQWEYMWCVYRDEDASNGVSVTNILTNAGRDGWQFTGYTEDTGWAVRFLMERRAA